MCTRCLQWLSLLASYTFLFLIELHDILGLHKEKKLLTTIVFLVIVITFSFLCRWLLYQKRAPADFFLSHVVNLLVNTRYTSSVSRYVLNFGSNIHFEREILLFQFQTIYLEIYNDSRFTSRLDYYYKIIIFEAIFGSIKMLNYNGWQLSFEF